MDAYDCRWRYKSRDNIRQKYKEIQREIEKKSACLKNVDKMVKSSLAVLARITEGQSISNEFVTI